MQNMHNTMNDYYSGLHGGAEPHGGAQQMRYGEPHHSSPPYGASPYGHGWGGDRGYEAPRGGGLPHSMQQLLWSEDFSEAVLRVCREKMDSALASQGYFPSGMQGAGYGATSEEEERRRAFKTVMDELRDAPSGEVARRVEARFTGLTPEERKLVIILAGENSHAKLAAKAGISVERMYELKRSLPAKLKLQN